MRVFLNIAPITHPYYRALVDHPPLSYVMPRLVDTSIFPDRWSRTTAKARALSALALGVVGQGAWREFGRWVLQQRVQRKARVGLSFPPIRGAVDLVHSCNRIPITKFPWIMDCESPITFCGAPPFTSLLDPAWRRFVLARVRDAQCRRLMPYSEAAGREILRYFDFGEAASKLEVVYPAYPEVAHFERPGPFPLRALFIGRAFYLKGGLSLLRVFRVLRRRWGSRIRLTMVTDLPCDVPADLLATEGLTLRARVSEEEKRVLLREAHVLLAPTFSDGTVTLLEAMAHGLPIVVSRFFHMGELVEHGRNGLTVESPLSPFGERFLRDWTDAPGLVRVIRVTDTSRFEANFAQAVEQFLEEPRLLKVMADHARWLVARGKFSIAHRNTQLRRIYEEACS